MTLSTLNLGNYGNSFPPVFNLLHDKHSDYTLQSFILRGLAGVLFVAGDYFLIPTLGL